MPQLNSLEDEERDAFTAGAKAAKRRIASLEEQLKTFQEPGTKKKS